MKKLHYILILSIAMFATSCCNCLKQDKNIATLENTLWKIIEVDGVTFPKGDAISDYTMTINGNRISGRGACNRFSGNFNLKPERYIDILNVSSARATCPDIEWETKMLKMLERADRYKIDSRILMLMDNNGILIGVFEAASNK